MEPNLAGQVFQTDIGAMLLVVARTLAVYFALLLGIRLAGKRELGQMTPFDLVVILVISNAVQNAMVGPDTSLNSGILAAFTLLLVNWMMNRTGLKFHWLGRRLTGTPTVLISQGQFIEQNLNREGLGREEVLMAAREHGVGSVEEVDLAVLEVDGTISIVPLGGARGRTRRRERGRKPTG